MDSALQAQVDSILLPRRFAFLYCGEPFRDDPDLIAEIFGGPASKDYENKHEAQCSFYCVSFNIGCVFAVAKICQFLLQVSDILDAAKYLFKFVITTVLPNILHLFEGYITGCVIPGVQVMCVMDAWIGSSSK